MIAKIEAIKEWEDLAAQAAAEIESIKDANVAISRAAKKLVRLIFALQTSGKAFQPA